VCCRGRYLDGPIASPVCRGMSPLLGLIMKSRFLKRDRGFPADRLCAVAKLPIPSCAVNERLKLSRTLAGSPASRLLELSDVPPAIISARVEARGGGFPPPACRGRQARSTRAYSCLPPPGASRTIWRVPLERHEKAGGRHRCELVLVNAKADTHDICCCAAGPRPSIVDRLRPQRARPRHIVG